MNSNEIVTEYGLDALAAVLHETAREKGFWDGEYNHDKIGNKLALVHSEVTEALEALRKDQGRDKFVEELADILIRVLDLWAGMDRVLASGLPSIHDTLVNKSLVNKKRDKLHGTRG